MKKLFFIRGFMVVVSTIIFYSLCILFYFIFFPAAGSSRFGSWLPNSLSTSGGSGYTLLRLNEAEKVSNVDVLFVGSSQVNRGFDVRVFEKHGLQTFNLGTSAQTLFNSYYLLKEYLPTMRPKYVVLDLYWGVAKNDGVEPSIDILSNSDLDKPTIEMVLGQDNGTVLSSLFTAYITRLHTPLNKIKQREFRNTQYITGGFVQSASVSNSLDKAELDQIESQTSTLNDFQAAYLHKIIALCKAQNTKLIFVIAPVTKELKRKVVNYNSYTNSMAALAKANNIPYFDYNQKKGFALVSSTDFSDRNHLDQSGAEKFNKAFIQDLKASGILAHTLSSK